MPLRLHHKIFISTGVVSTKLTCFAKVLTAFHKHGLVPIAFTYPTETNGLAPRVKPITIAQSTKTPHDFHTRSVIQNPMKTLVCVCVQKPSVSPKRKACEQSHTQNSHENTGGFPKTGDLRVPLGCSRVGFGCSLGALWLLVFGFRVTCGCALGARV